MAALGIDVKLFLGQIINFLILLLILWRFAYKPIVKMLNDRRERIASSIANAKKIEEDLIATEQKTRGMLDQAQEEGQKVLENSNFAASAQKKEIVALAKNQAEKEITRAKESINQERELAAKALQKETIALVRLATEKILRQETSAALQKQAIDEAIEDLGRNNK